MMWIPILLICSLPVSGALWAKKKVTGIVGRAITIDCHYGASYQSSMKYWCHGWTRQCSVLVKSNGQHERISITDNKKQGIFIVTMKDLRSEDAGKYSCGIENWSFDPMFAVELQISYESVSVPDLRFLSPPNVSCSGGSVSVSCKSVQGSLPIQYTWYEKIPSEDSKISDSSKLDLHCQSFTQQHHQYYCTASNNQGEKSSEMVNVSDINRSGESCSYVIQIDSIGLEYFCEVSSTVSPTTTHSTSTNIISTDYRNQSSKLKPDKSLLYIVLGVLAVFLVVFAVSLLLYLRQFKKGTNYIIRHRKGKTVNENQQLATVEESAVYANINHIPSGSAETHSEGAAKLNNENGITYAALQFQKKSSARSGEVAKCSVNNEDSVIYSGLNILSQSPKNNRETPSVDTPQDTQMAIYATVTR
ncbi:uncharacterized protein [Heterodontus francisci]|uniref:uncharacterized protein n=1 Tax=Heterodontus francisci TaxID=7792 RepID=UPI00355C0943